MSAEAAIYGTPTGPSDNILGDLSAVAAVNAADTSMDRRAPRFSWTTSYEATFFRSLCHSVQLGLRENHSFKAEAWDLAAEALREKHGAYPTKAHLVNKSDNARKKFRLWRGLREDPEFLYNPVTKMVTASQAAWDAHIAKEPLSRSLRQRAFEHEEYMEILYPDVIGSGGAPKRIMRPRRKGPDALSGTEELSTPGTAVMDLARDAYGQAPTGPDMMASAPPATTPVVAGAPSIQDAPPARRGPGRPPTRSIGNISALTPPDDPPNSAGPRDRKRFHPENHVPLMTSKTRRNPGLGLHGSALQQSDASLVLEESLIAVAEAIKASRTNQEGWPAQALEIFFRDFSDEDFDFQLKVAGQNALLDENKAMAFVKMTPPLRKHWIARLRELYNRGGGGGVVVAGNVMG